MIMEDTSPPKLRWPLDVRTDFYEGERVIVLSCPYGISPTPLALIHHVEPILAFLDGNRSKTELYEKFLPAGFSEKNIDELLSLLDEGLFLETPHFLIEQKKFKEKYFALTTRASSHAGYIFERDRPLLENQIDSFLVNKETALCHDSTKLCCLISPHIDYRRGGHTYGQAYHHLKGSNHDLYILIGTSHKYSPHLFHLTKKNFENPLGILSCENMFVERLAHRYGYERSFSDEILHASEHSLELQVPFLLRVLKKPAMIPILVGGFYDLLRNNILPEKFEPYESFAAALTEELSSWCSNGKTFCFVAGVDMAHVGRQFGDISRLTEDKLNDIRREDQIYLHAIQTGDNSLLWEHVKKDFDARRLCGFPTMYFILDILKRLNRKTSAQLFEYNQAVDFDTDCCVSFSAMGLYHS